MNRTPPGSAARLRRAVLLGAPRSGTTWLGEIINSSPQVLYRYQPLHAYTFEHLPSPTASESEVSEFFQALQKSDDPYVTRLRSSAFGASLPEFPKSDPRLILFKETHFPEVCANMVSATTDVRMVGIIRDPVAALTSWINVLNEFDPDWSIADEWEEAPLKNRGRPGHAWGFGGWVRTNRVLLDLRGEAPERVLLVRYEELVEESVVVTERIFAFLGLDVSRQSLEFIDASMSRTDPSPYGVHRRADLRLDRRLLPASIADTVRQKAADFGLGDYVQP